VRLCIENK
jgi:hypothetical protein